MKLIAGKGSPTTGACWMSALFYYTEYDEGSRDWSDYPKCVSPVLQQLCVGLNDSCISIAEREELIGPHLFDPMGTDMKDDPKRMAILEEVAREEGFPGPNDANFGQAFKRKWQNKRKGPEGKRRLLAVILRLCRIGTPQETVPRRSKEALFERLEK